MKKYKITPKDKAPVYVSDFNNAIQIVAICIKQNQPVEITSYETNEPEEKEYPYYQALVATQKMLANQEKCLQTMQSVLNDAYGTLKGARVRIANMLNKNKDVKPNNETVSTSCDSDGMH